MIVEKLLIILLGMTPIVGIRGAIPTAIGVYNMDVFTAYYLSVIGEFFPVIFIILLLGSVSSNLSKNFSFFRKFFDKLFEKTKGKHEEQIKRYGPIALFFIAAIPVPFSGAWTTSLLVFLFGLPFWPSVIAIFLGILAAGINILLIMGAGQTIEKHHGIGVVILITIIALVLYFIYHQRKLNKKNKCQN